VAVLILVTTENWQINAGMFHADAAGTSTGTALILQQQLIWV